MTLACPRTFERFISPLCFSALAVRMMKPLYVIKVTELSLLSRSVRKVCGRITAQCIGRQGMASFFAARQNKILFFIFPFPPFAVRCYYTTNSAKKQTRRVAGRKTFFNVFACSVSGQTRDLMTLFAAAQMTETCPRSLHTAPFARATLALPCTDPLTAEGKRVILPFRALIDGGDCAIIVAGEQSGTSGPQERRRR